MTDIVCRNGIWHGMGSILLPPDILWLGHMASDSASLMRAVLAWVEGWM